MIWDVTPRFLSHTVPPLAPLLLLLLLSLVAHLVAGDSHPIFHCSTVAYLRDAARDVSPINNIKHGCSRGSSVNIMRPQRRRRRRRRRFACYQLIKLFQTTRPSRGRSEEGERSQAERAMPSFRVALYFFAGQRQRCVGGGAHTTCHAPWSPSPAQPAMCARESERKMNYDYCHVKEQAKCQSDNA